MSRRYPCRIAIALIALIALITGVFAWINKNPGDPVVHGKPISVWMDKLGGGEVLSLEEYKALGPDAVTICVKIVECKESAMSRAYRQHWRKLPSFCHRWLPKPAASREYSRFQAAMLLTQLPKSDAERSIPVLLRVLNDDDDVFTVRSAAALSLGILGETNQTVSNALLEALQDNEALVREAATNALLQVDPVAAASAGIRSNVNELKVSD